MLDYDGTLSPIVSSPDQAFVPTEVEEVIRSIADLPETKVCVISGRSLKDLSARIPVPGIALVGNHGMEAEGLDLDVPSETSAGREALSDLAREVTARVGGIPGAVVEDKGLTISLHYRNASKKDVPRIKRAFWEGALKHPEIKVAQGRKVLEARPRGGRDKGQVTAAILDREAGAHPGLMALYAGDDTTDEHAFRSLRGRAVTVKVEGEFRGLPTQAQLRVEGPSSLYRGLAELLSERRAWMTTSIPERRV